MYVGNLKTNQLLNNDNNKKLTTAVWPKLGRAFFTCANLHGPLPHRGLPTKTNGVPLCPWDRRDPKTAVINYNIFCFLNIKKAYVVNILKKA